MPIPLLECPKRFRTKPRFLFGENSLAYAITGKQITNALNRSFGPSLFRTNSTGRFECTSTTTKKGGKMGSGPGAGWCKKGPAKTICNRSNGLVGQAHVRTGAFQGRLRCCRHSWQVFTRRSKSAFSLGDHVQLWAIFFMRTIPGWSE